MDITAVSVAAPVAVAALRFLSGWVRERHRKARAALAIQTLKAGGSYFENAVEIRIEISPAVPDMPCSPAPEDPQ